MDNQRFEKVRALFLEVRPMEPEQQDAALSAACESDLDLRVEVEDLLRADTAASTITKVSSDADRSQEVSTISVPGYQVHRVVGDGGQGIVYAAIQLATGRRVALKVLKAMSYGSPVTRARFDREVSVLAALEHPNIVAITDRGLLADGSPFLAMQYVDGVPLSQWLLTRTPNFADPIDAAKPIVMFITICEALNVAHLKGITHRDLKPANILIDERDHPHVVDFGLAGVMVSPAAHADTGITMTGSFMGSLPWASPEQANGQVDKVDMRSDVYSLGVLLYQMVTGGQFPYEVAGTMKQVLDNILTAQPPPPSAVILRGERKRRLRLRRLNKLTGINAELDAIVLKALSKRRDDRYANAGELAVDLSDYLAGRTVAATNRQVRRSISRTTIALWAGAAALLLAAAGTYFALYKRPMVIVSDPFVRPHKPQITPEPTVEPAPADTIPISDGDVDGFWDKVGSDPRKRSPAVLTDPGLHGLGIEPSAHPLIDAAVASLMATELATAHGASTAQMESSLTVVSRALEKTVAITGPNNPVADRLLMVKCRLLWGVHRGADAERMLTKVLDDRFGGRGTSASTLWLRDNLLVLMVLDAAPSHAIIGALNRYTRRESPAYGTPGWGSATKTHDALQAAAASHDLHGCLYAIDIATDTDWQPTADNADEIVWMKQASMQAYKNPWDGANIYRAPCMYSRVLIYAEKQTPDATHLPIIGPLLSEPRPSTAPLNPDPPR